MQRTPHRVGYSRRTGALLTLLPTSLFPPHLIYALLTLLCVCVCVCVCEVLPSGRRGNPHSAVPSCLARSPPILTYILRFYFYFVLFFFFCSSSSSSGILLLFSFSREVPSSSSSHRGRLYIFPLSLSHSIRFSLFF